MTRSRAIVRNLIFVVFFSVDVSVHASMLESLKSPVQEPKHCLAQNEICAISTFMGTKYSLKLGDTRITLGEDTFVTRLDRDRYQLVKGELLVQAEDEIIVETEYGNVSVYRGEALIARTSKRVATKCLKGQVKLTPKGGLPLEVEKGFENSLAAVGSNGAAETEIPQLVDSKTVVREWARLYNGPKKDFEKSIEVWINEWPALVTKSSRFHLDLMKRTVASEQDESEKELRRRKAQEAERRRLRELYKTKTFEY